MCPSWPRKIPGVSQMNTMIRMFHYFDHSEAVACIQSATTTQLSAIDATPEIVQNFGPDLPPSSRDKESRHCLILFVINLLHSGCYCG